VRVQRLQQAGYADRVPDPTTAAPSSSSSPPRAGQHPTAAASDRIRQAGTTGMQAALAHWPPQERHQFATLLHRMVDDFLAYAAGEEPGQPAR
jgi:hypothetical protein